MNFYNTFHTYGDHCYRRFDHKGLTLINHANLDYPLVFIILNGGSILCGLTSSVIYWIIREAASLFKMYREIRIFLNLWRQGIKRFYPPVMSFPQFNLKLTKLYFSTAMPECVLYYDYSQQIHTLWLAGIVSEDDKMRSSLCNAPWF